MTFLVERECSLMPIVQFVSCHFTGPWFVLDQHAEVLNHCHNITCTCFVIRAHYPPSVKNQSLLLSLIGPYLVENRNVLVGSHEVSSPPHTVLEEINITVTQPMSSFSTVYWFRESLNWLINSFFYLLFFICNYVGVVNHVRYINISLM